MKRMLGNKIVERTDQNLIMDSWNCRPCIMLVFQCSDVLRNIRVVCLFIFVSSPPQSISSGLAAKR